MTKVGLLGVVAHWGEKRMLHKHQASGIMLQNGRQVLQLELTPWELTL